VVGISLAIVLGHQLSADDVRGLPDRVFSCAPMREAAEALWTTMLPRWGNLGAVDEFRSLIPDQFSAMNIEAAWEQTAPGAEELVTFHWAGFRLVFGRRAIFAAHLEKLIGFVLNLDGLREPLRACARALARQLRSPLVAYGPDSALPFERTFDSVIDGHSLDDVLVRAAELCGEPAQQIEGMMFDGRECREQHGYFVEVIDYVR